MKKVTQILFALCTVILFAACGEGEKKDSKTSNKASEVQTYRYHMDSLGDIYQTNPNNPSSPSIVRKDMATNFQATWLGSVNAGTFSSGQITQLHKAVHIFSDDHHFYQLKALVTSTENLPIRISAIDNLIDLCDDSVKIFSDYHQLNNSVITFQLATGGGNCSTLTSSHHAIRLGDSETQNAIDNIIPIVAALYATNGQLQGFLANNNGSLVQLDQDLANPLVLKHSGGANVSGSQFLLLAQKEQHNLIALADLIGNWSLYHWNSQSQQLSPRLTSSFDYDLNAEYNSDSTHVYYHDAINIMRIAIDGSESDETLIGTASNQLSNMLLSNNHVVYLQSTSIFSIDKTASNGSSLQLLLPDQSTIEVQQLIAVQGDWVYYNSVNSNSVTQAGLVKTDNTVSRIFSGHVITNALELDLGAQWVGHTYATSQAMFSQQISPATLLMLEISSIHESGDYIHSLNAFDANTGNKTATLGLLQVANTDLLEFNNLVADWGSFQFASITQATTNPRLYSYNSTQANSLTSIDVDYNGLTIIAH
ncbi:MAG: hypothetical protein OEY38_10345 [Gammaproteobacteria bacterium]|nr:hypothetical protein [Gammaproteobacteria bacterium]